MPPDVQDPEIILQRADPDCTANTIKFYGQATDNIAVDHVEWENIDTGGSGNCTWVDPDWEQVVPVQTGQNRITFTAVDTSNNTAALNIWIDWTPCAGGGTTTIVKKVIWLGD